MIEQLKVGDKLTVIKVNSMASTSINQITIDSMQEGKAVFAVKRKRYYLSADNHVLVLRGHNLGITQGSWKDGGSCFIMDSNCNLGGLDREAMIALLQTNINPQFDQWKRIYWFDGTSEEGDPLFVPRPATDNYLRYREQAEQNNAKTAGQLAVGDFIYSYCKASKHYTLTDMLKYHLRSDSEVKEYLSLGKIAAIMEMSEEQFDALQYMGDDIELPDRGGNFSDDLTSECDMDNLSEFERETFYSHLTLIRTPSGRAITVDAQGYDYMRYTGLLSHYKTSMAADCAKAQECLRIEREEAECERQAKRAEATQQEQTERTRVEKEYPFLMVATEDDWQKTAANNLRTLLKHTFPTIKFSVKKYSYGYYIVSWTDGPSDEQVSNITQMFRSEGFDGMTDSSYSISSPFIDRYGGVGCAHTERTISEHLRKEELALLNEELGKSYKMDDYVSERCERASTLVSRRTCKKDYTPVVEPKPIAKYEPKPSKPSVPPITTERVEIIDYSEKAFAVIGDTKPIKDTLKQLGGSFNGRLSCGAGWIFSKAKMATVKQTLSIA